MDQIDLGQAHSQQSKIKSVIFSEHVVVKKIFFYVLNCLLLLFAIYAVIISILYVNYSKSFDKNNVIPTTPTIPTTTTTEDPFGDGPWQNPVLSDAIIPSDYQLTLRVYPELETYEGFILFDVKNMKFKILLK